MLYSLIAGYCVLCYIAAFYFMATELIPLTTYREVVRIGAAVALAPITVPAAVLFACVMSMIQFKQ